VSDNMIDTTTGDGWQADDAAPVEPSTTPSPAAMPQRITPPAPAQAQDDADDQGEGDDGDDLTPHDLDKQRQLRNEARNMRKRAKAAEGELDTLRSVVDGLRRGEVERLAAAELNDARDLLDRHELGDFLDEGGNVDPGKVSAAARVLVDERPHMAAPPVVTAPPTNRPIEGLTPGASPQRKAQEATTWAGALGPLVR
jgi:hypothetical protein